ncbi:MAG: hypothetical protein HY905_01545 [Deltaproteobacteria bacterium]|nr:hypothetical protein [Deltaproteobacteria bacterium]
MKQRMLAAPYEICLARALHFTRAHRENEALDPHLRNALALRRTLERQKIAIEPDELLAGSKTERFLAAPLPVERGDFLRSLQLELDVLERKHRPFRISDADREAFWNEILPYWDGRTVRDRKARTWAEAGIVQPRPSAGRRLRGWLDAVRWAFQLGPEALRKLFGANFDAPLTLRRVRNLHALRHELAFNNPTPATSCFDVQGHLSLGVDRAVSRGMEAIIDDARERRARLDREEPGDERGRSFLDAVVISLEAAIAYAARFAALAGAMAARCAEGPERRRLESIAEHCRQVPRHRPRTFHEALQSAWMTQLVGEIQYGAHDVFAVGRPDQYLLPFFRADRAAGRLARPRAVELLQEFFLKLEANVEPIPEVGMETNAVLGNSQHVVTIGGLTPDGGDATNELSYLVLDAFEAMGGAVNQLAVRVHRGTPGRFLRRTAEVFRRTNGIALYGDEAVIEGLCADGLTLEHARDYCIVGCIETSGQSNTHGCVGGHELVLPAVLLLALSRGRTPAPFLGQGRGFDSGPLEACRTFDEFLGIFRRQLDHQLGVLVAAADGKDRATMDLLPAPYVSALMDGCLESARDATAGGARYDFTSIDVRGLGTLVDSLLAIRAFVHERRAVTLPELAGICERDFAGHEVLRQRLIHEPPKYGTGEAEGIAMAREVLGWLHGAVSGRRNARGGRFRMCYYSYGNHVIDGFLLGGTPDGRRRGEPLSNGVSPSNLLDSAAGPTGVLRTVAALPPRLISSGVSLNMRFFPDFLATDGGRDAFAAMIRTYFGLGGMHLQPNVVSMETLREAQRNPERYRDLVVKVSGYSAYFTDLGRSIQDDIVARCEYSG